MPEKFLRRYTTLPSLIYSLTEQKLTLLDPQSWDDKNDSYYLQLYREKKHLKSVLALCFTLGSETYHHWSVFADGPAGVCIQFDRKELVDALRARAGLRTGKVKYLLLTESRKRRLEVSELPFCKRYAYQHESEFRAIYESKRRTVGSLDIPFSLASISRIYLEPLAAVGAIESCKGNAWGHQGLREALNRSLNFDQQPGVETSR